MATDQVQGGAYLTSNYSYVDLQNASAAYLLPTWYYEYRCTTTSRELVVL